jgi:7-keto-8-aminopelargonate synthetase-like enzyme
MYWNCLTGTLPPPSCAAALEGIKIIKSEPERIELLKKNTKYLIDNLRKLNFVLGEHVGPSPIIPILIPDDSKLLAMFHETRQRKLQIFISMFLAVPQNKGRIRLLSAAGFNKECME